MSWLLLTTGFFIYCLQASFVYLVHLKTSSWYYLVGLLCPVLANILFLTLARLAGSQSATMAWAALWDTGILVAYFIVPVLFFGVRPSPVGYFGLSLLLAGALIMKLSLR